MSGETVNPKVNTLNILISSGNKSVYEKLIFEKD